MILANCGLHGCPPVPLWIGIPMGLVGLAVIVLTICDLIRRR